MRPTYEDIHRLVLKMREGSKEARRELIEAHVPLAFKAAEKFDDDEALSDALETLVLEVDNFRSSDKHPAALPSYLKTALGRAAKSSRRERTGKRDRPNNRHCAANDARRFLYSGRTLPDPSAHAIDAMDEVLAACETEEERQMVHHKSLGKTFEEVALAMGLSKTTVFAAMQRLELRYKVQERLRA